MEHVDIKVRHARTFLTKLCVCVRAQVRSREKQSEQKPNKINIGMNPSGIEPEPLAWKASMIPFHHESWPIQPSILGTRVRGHD